MRIASSSKFSLNIRKFLAREWEQLKPIQMGHINQAIFRSLFPPLFNNSSNKMNGLFFIYRNTLSSSSHCPQQTMLDIICCLYQVVLPSFMKSVFFLGMHASELVAGITSSGTTCSSATRECKWDEVMWLLDQSIRFQATLWGMMTVRMYTQPVYSRWTTTMYGGGTTSRFHFEKWHTLHENPIHFYGGSAPSTAEIWYCTQPTLLCRSFDHNEWTQWARTNFGAPIFTQNGHLNGHFDQFRQTVPPTFSQTPICRLQSDANCSRAVQSTGKSGPPYFYFPFTCGLAPPAIAAS